MEKSDRHDQWSVLNLLTYNFGVKDNFEQGGIVPLNCLCTYPFYLAFCSACEMSSVGNFRFSAHVFVARSCFFFAFFYACRYTGNGFFLFYVYGERIYPFNPILRRRYEAARNRAGGGGGGFRNPRTNHAPRHRSQKRKKAFDSSSKVFFRNYLGHIFLNSSVRADSLPDN